MKKIFFDKYEHYKSISCYGCHYGVCCIVDDAFPCDLFDKFLDDLIYIKPNIYHVGTTICTDSILSRFDIDYCELELKPIGYRPPMKRLTIDICNFVCCVCEIDCISYNCFIYNFEKIYNLFLEDKDYRFCLESLYKRQPCFHRRSAESAFVLLAKFIEWINNQPNNETPKQ